MMNVSGPLKRYWGNTPSASRTVLAAPRFHSPVHFGADPEYPKPKTFWLEKYRKHAITEKACGLLSLFFAMTPLPFLAYAPLADLATGWKELCQITDMTTAMAIGVNSFNFLQHWHLPQWSRRAEKVLPSHLTSAQWPSNTKIYASSLQEQESRSEPELNLGYLMDMAKNISSQKTPSLNAAHQQIPYVLQNTLREFQIPVTSANPATGWVKQERKPRFILVITGNEERFTTMTQTWTSTLKQAFQIPDDHVRTMKTPDLKTFKSGFQWLKEQQQTHPHAEAMVVVSSHGNSRRDPKIPKQHGDYQGSRSGSVNVLGEKAFAISKQAMKRLFHTYLKEFDSVAFMMATCYAGAWVA